MDFDFLYVHAHIPVCNLFTHPFINTLMNGTVVIVSYNLICLYDLLVMEAENYIFFTIKGSHFTV